MTSETTAIANQRMLATMGQIDRREWWLWSSAISVNVLLAIGIASFALVALLSGFSDLHVFFLGHAVRGLFGLVLIFNIYVVYEQIQINHLRHEFAANLYSMAILDPVTSIFNRRFVIQRLEEEVSRCERHGRPLTVIAFDLDSFKQINDERGHAVGDEVLRTFGEQLKKVTRGSDVVARYGGDEFLAVLPDCSLEQLAFVFERLNDLHAETDKSLVQIRYSAGWTDYIQGESVSEMLERADEMLYANKRSSKHRIGKH